MHNKHGPMSQMALLWTSGTEDEKESMSQLHTLYIDGSLLRIDF